MLSVNKRPWFEHLRPYVERYASSCQADPIFHIHDELPREYSDRLQFLPPSDNQVMAQLAKLLCISDALREYDRVLLLDDSCFIAPECPDIFKMAPIHSLCGVADEGGGKKQDRAQNTMNIGVLCVSKVHRIIFNQLEDFYDAFSEGKNLRDQDLVNLILDTGTVAHSYLEHRFNVVGSELSDELIRNKTAFIYHLTSAMSDAERLHMARLLCEVYPAH